MKKTQAKTQKSPTAASQKRRRQLDLKAKPILGTLAEISALAEAPVTLLAGEEILWQSPAVKVKREARTKKKVSGGAGRPEKTDPLTSVDELQAMREARSQKARAQVEGKKKASPAKAVKPQKNQPAPFTVTRPAAAAPKKKRA